MSGPFKITEHIIEGQHIRHYPRATATPNAPLKLCIKQYTPLTNTNPQPGDVTIIATHGTGYPKELYEPLWEDLLSQAQQNSVRIRSIWMADSSNSGASGILNEQHLGNDPSWHDHSRDLLHMINVFRDQMPQPIMGIGHSLGAGQLIFLSIFHPRLFTSLGFIEPYMNDDNGAPDVALLVRMSSTKRDIWPSRGAAIEKARKALKDWDPRVFQLWTEFGYRDLPTAVYSGSGSPGNSPAQDQDTPVTLATTKYQEAMMHGRVNPRQHVQLGLSGVDERSPPHDALEVPDVLGVIPHGMRAYRHEPVLAAKLVPFLRPSVLYVIGSRSPLCQAGTLQRLVKETGTSFGGSGGMQYGRVKSVMEDGSHALPQEKVGAVAKALAPWMRQEVQRWERDEARVLGGWEGRSRRERAMFPAGWMEIMGDLPGLKRASKV